MSRPCPACCTEIDHVAIAVRDLEAAIDYYREAFGAEVEHREVVESDGVEEALLKVADCYIQLLTPTRHDSPVAKYLEKRGEGLHHVGYRVDDCGAGARRREGRGRRGHRRGAPARRRAARPSPSSTRRAASAPSSSSSRSRGHMRTGCVTFAEHGRSTTSPVSCNTAGGPDSTPHGCRRSSAGGHSPPPRHQPGDISIELGTAVVHTLPRHPDDSGGAAPHRPTPRSAAG